MTGNVLKLFNSAAVLVCDSYPLPKVMDCWTSDEEGTRNMEEYFCRMVHKICCVYSPFYWRIF